MKFKTLTLCLDMQGCPNRCRHCWLGCTPNGNLSPAVLSQTAGAFAPYASSLSVYSWYREPDYLDNYRELWDLCQRLSGEASKPVHYEIVSFWRLVRDESYVKWLSSLGLKAAQLTLFGGPEMTDYYIGRKGAYEEILRAIDILIENRISPRLQFFVNQETVVELPHVQQLIESLRLRERCAAFGGRFSFFLHQGSCDGENQAHYGIWITPEDLAKIPPLLAEETLRHFGKKSLIEVFGRTEAELYEEFLGDSSTASYVEESPAFFVDRDLNVYPNISTPTPHWCLGNLESDGPERVIANYRESRTPAQHTRLTVPLCELVRAGGDPESRRLFGRGDYIELLLNRYCASGRGGQNPNSL